MSLYIIVTEFGDVFKTSSDEVAKQAPDDYNLVIDITKMEVVLSKQEIDDGIDPVIKDWPYSENK
jgi:hypothetical protein